MSTDAISLALQSIDRDADLLTLLAEHTRRIDSLVSIAERLAAIVKDRDAELAEIRDDVLALSNRIEAVTRAAGGGLHSVPS